MTSLAARVQLVGRLYSSPAEGLVDGFPEHWCLIRLDVYQVSDLEIGQNGLAQVPHIGYPMQDLPRQTRRSEVLKAKLGLLNIGKRVWKLFRHREGLQRYRC